MINFKSAALFTVFGVLLASLAGSLRAAPDQTLGMAILSVTYNSSLAKIVRGAGVVNVDEVEPGEYEVHFVRSVANCVPVASDSVSPLTFVRAVPDSGGWVNVVTFNTAGSATSSSFNLIVFCAE